MSKVLLFYKYVTIANPEELRSWHLKIGEKLNLTGRVLLAEEGINATLGGSIEAIESYKQELQKNPIFCDIDFKESEGGPESFPRLSVKVKKEIVHLGIDTKQYTAENGGIHLEPQEVHELLQQRPEDLVILDARNNYESAIGQFINQITPDIKTFREFPAFIDENLALLKDKKVLMHCTGGVRCERATTYLKSKGVTQEVYQIKMSSFAFIAMRLSKT